MNKCQFCGANVDIETPFCPYCGNSKKQYQEHRDDMQRYNAAFHQVEEDVVLQNRKTSSKAASLTIIFVLITLILLLLFGFTQVYNIGTFFGEIELNKHADEYRAQLDTMIDERDYESIDLFFRYQVTNSSTRNGNALAAYSGIRDATSNYFYAESFMSNALFSEGYDDEMRINQTGYFVNTYEYLQKSYNRYSARQDEYSYDDPANYSEEHVAVIKDILDILNAEVKVYYQLSDEEMTEFLEGNETARAYILDKAMRRIIAQEHAAQATDDDSMTNDKSEAISSDTTDDTTDDGEED